MKVFRFDGGRIGATINGMSHDLTEALDIDPLAWPPVQMIALIADFDKRTAGIAKHHKARPIDLAAVRLDVPIAWPNKLLGYPVNYPHPERQDSNLPRADVSGFFIKANSSLSGPSDPILLPNPPGREILHECEVGIVIGSKGRNIARAHAFDHIFGYACLIDVTMLGKEERAMRKSYDSFCPFGPWITTADEVPNPDGLQAKLWVNGELRQNGNTRHWILDVAGMIELASKAVTLMPGDIIASGSVDGVGPMQPGDKVRIAIENLDEMNLEVRQG